MSESLAAQLGTNPSLESSAPQSSRDAGAGMASALQQSHILGRRVTLGGMNRRSSLGMAEAALGDLFGRRASGFGELDVLGRRGSLDSTSAVLDAAIMDLTRRRLSMAMGTMPGEDPFGSMGGAFGNTNMDAMGAAFAGAGAASSALSPSNANQATALSSPTAAASSSETGNAKDTESSDAITNRQKKLQEQQRDLERRQKELEVQRQQLVAAMEERKRVMQQMQQKMGQVPSGGAAVQRNSLLGSLGGGLGAGLGTSLGGGLASSLGGGLGAGLGAGLGGGLGGGLNGSIGNGISGGLNGRLGSGLANSLGGGLGPGNLNGGAQNLLMGLGARGLAGAGASLNAGGNNAMDNKPRPFPGREEAAQQEAIFMALEKGRRASLGLGMNPRRSSLDLLVGTLDRPEFASRLAAPLVKQELAGRRDSLMGGFSDRRFSISGDIQNHSQPRQVSSTSAANASFANMTESLPLAMDSDKDWLTPLHCFVRRHCVEVFTATEKDVATPSKGKRKPIQVGQVGIRCPHCHHEETAKARERGSVYYPTSIASIYNATMNLLQRHLHNCNSVPADVMRRYETLKADDARSGTSKKYWVESALSLGLVDTPNGIRYSTSVPPPLPGISSQQISTGNYSNARRNSNDFFSSSSNTMVDMTQGANNAALNQVANANMALLSNSQRGNVSTSNPAISHDAGIGGLAKAAESEQAASSQTALVTPADEPYATSFSYHLLLQMQPCVFTEADRLGKRKGLPPGFPGLACRHCFGGYGSGRFFPSSIKTLSDTSKTLNVLHNHMMRCRKCPPDVRDTLSTLRKTHDEQRAKMKFGSQKAFFARIWDRLHYKDPNVTSKRKFKAQDDQPGPNAFPGNVGNPMEAALQPTPFDTAMAMQQYGNLMKRQKLA